MGDATVNGALQSATYQSDNQGWRLSSDGKAEFNSLVARGRIETAVFSERKISAISGTVLIAEASSLKQAVARKTTISWSIPTSSAGMTS